MPFESKPHFIEGMKYPLAPDAQETPPEACVFSIGDKVTFTNDYGVEFHNKVITGFSPMVEHGRFVYLDKDSWWFPVSPDSLSRPLEERQAAADLQYQGYDFGDGVKVTDHDGWEHTTPGDERQHLGCPDGARADVMEQG